MNKLPGAPFLWSLHPAGAQNITIISNTGSIWGCETKPQSVINKGELSSNLLDLSFKDLGKLCV